MKERIKKFYRDHEEKVTLGLLAVGTASMIVGIKLLKQQDVTVDYLFVTGEELPEDTRIHVFLTNGETRKFKPPTK